jgi:hypothetical protein
MSHAGGKHFEDENENEEDTLARLGRPVKVGQTGSK